MPYRVKESDLIIPMLRILAASPNGFVSTTDLIAGLEHHFEPEGLDAAILMGRHDTRFSQKVRNLVSHRGAQRGLETMGLAQHQASNHGWLITNTGRTYLAAAEAINE